MIKPKKDYYPQRKMSRRIKKLFNAYLGEAAGNGAKAAEIAGYSLPARSAHRLLKEHKEVLKDLEDKWNKESTLQSSRIDLLLSEIAVSKEEQSRDRIRAMEILAKLQGRLNEKVQLDKTQLVKDLDTAVEKLVTAKILTIDPIVTVTEGDGKHKAN